jgi:hypothetical protein
MIASSMMNTESTIHDTRLTSHLERVMWDISQSKLKL